VSITFQFGLLSAVVAAVGCVGGTTVTSTHTIGSLTGTLIAGVVEWEGEPLDCVWLEDPSGRRFDLFFPSDWDQRLHPLRIVDWTGREIAREGDVLRVTYNADGIGESLCSPEIPIVPITVEKVGPPAGSSVVD